MSSTWLRRLGKNIYIGQVELGRLAEELMRRSSLGRMRKIIPFFRYRRLIIMIDTPKEKSNA